MGGTLWTRTYGCSISTIALHRFTNPRLGCHLDPYQSSHVGSACFEWRLGEWGGSVRGGMRGDFMVVEEYGLVYQRPK